MDYCTGWFEGWWAHCCQAHDLAYVEQVGRSAADAGLFQCVVSSLPGVVASDPVLAVGAAVASAAIGGVMWVGVRVFGRRFYRKAAQSQ